MQTQITISVDRTLKSNAAQKARKQGLTLSGLTSLFYQDFVQNEQALIDRLEGRMFDNALQSAPVKKRLTRLGNAL